MNFKYFTRMPVGIVALVLIVFLFSCKKEASLSNNDPEPPATEEQASAYADEASQAEASFDDVEDIALLASFEESIVSEGSGRIFPFLQLRLRLGPCATVSVTPQDSTYPKTVTIDFGAGCLCADGKFRKGSVVIHLTGPIRQSGSVMVITYVDFYLNRRHIEGSNTITNLSANGNIKFTVQVAGGKVTFPNGRGFAYEGLKYVRQVEGGTTTTLQDDVFLKEGRSETHYNNGTAVVLNTETPLMKKRICPWINQGVLKIKINGHTFHLDYGAPANGDCDNKALLTWGNANAQLLITLP